MLSKFTSTSSTSVLVATGDDVNSVALDMHSSLGYKVFVKFSRPSSALRNTDTGMYHTHVILQKMLCKNMN